MPIHVRTLFILFALTLLPALAGAQTDEIQVYDGGLADVGKFNLTWHHNFTPIGQKEPAFPGALISDKAFIGVPEWAYGITKWFEMGLYMPLCTSPRTVARRSTALNCARYSLCRRRMSALFLWRQSRIQL